VLKGVLRVLKGVTKKKGAKASVADYKARVLKTSAADSQY
jgi:hypothetical protein